MLTDEQIRAAWKVGKSTHDGSEWEKANRHFVDRFRRMTEEEFRRPETQEELWQAPVGGIGPGRSVRVEAAYSDRAVVDALLALRDPDWPIDPRARAGAAEAEFQRILELISPRLAKRRPQAKLLRVISILRPEDTNKNFNWSSHGDVSELLLGKRSGVHRLEGQVLARARLREVLESEDDLDEHVRRAMFCWWLHRHYEVLMRGEMPSGGTGTDPDGKHLEAPLKPWSYQKQFKGMWGLARNLEVYREIVRAALPGATRDDLIEAAQALGESEEASPKVPRGLIRNLNGLGLIAPKDGLFRPTREGEEFVESEEPDVFVERILERVFGAAQMLRLLQGEAKGLTRADAAEGLMQLHAGWTTRTMPYALLRWGDDVGLIEALDEVPRFGLSDYGRVWAERLPAELPVSTAKPPLPDLVEVGEGDTATEEKPFPSLADIRRRFAEDPEIKGFVFDPDQIASLHLAWRSNPKKRFVLLSGLSGTGKTAITRCFARAVCALMKLDLAQHLAIVPVSPDWIDPTGLLGYLNSLHSEPSFRMEPALRLVLRAHEKPELPFFLVLDEMNLARVERYFAPFLSAMETGGQIDLHAEKDAVQEVPASVAWTRNLYIAGTVNMDETTHPFSDKVLDRAFTLEFWEVDLAEFFKRQAQQHGRTEVTRRAEEVLLQLNEKLAQVRRHFGYRTAGEVLAFVRSAEGVGADQVDPKRMLDQAVFAKVLPRLRGEDRADLRTAVDEAITVCKQHGLGRCESKLRQMVAQLDQFGLMRFWS